MFIFHLVTVKTNLSSSPFAINPNVFKKEKEFPILIQIETLAHNKREGKQ